jgi:acyl-CoA thioesterase II
MFTIDEFLTALALESVGTDTYRGVNLQTAHGVVFGGQLLAQAVIAGSIGQEDKHVKTIHTVFSRGAALDLPLDIDVDRMHAGRSMASSMVTIRQGDRLCTRSLVLLSGDEADVIRHADTPRSPSTPDDVAGITRTTGAWEIGVVGAVDVNDPDLVGPPELDVWARFVGAPEDSGINQALLAFSTEPFLIGTAMRPHAGVGQSQAHKSLSTGVLSHTLTFHEAWSASEWHLLSHWSSYGGRGRSFGRGDVYGTDGQLVASFMQDAMIRPHSGSTSAL